jgi:hypothetical protein
MPIKEFEVRTVGIDYICDECLEGKMLPTGGSMLLSDPPQFAHQCDNINCCAKANFTERYPTFRVERA